VGSIPANSNAQNVPSFRRWRVEMKLSPFFRTRRSSRPALWVKVQPIGRGCCNATHRERTFYWILGKFFSNTLPASCSIAHKRVDAENIGFLHHSIDLDTLIEQEDLSNDPFVHLYMPGMYILYWVCSGHCNRLNRWRARRRRRRRRRHRGRRGRRRRLRGRRRRRRRPGGEDDKDDNRPSAANEEDDAGEASGCQESRRRRSGADSTKTPGAKKAAAVSGPPPCLALSVSGPVQRTPSPGCPMAPPRCVLNHKHPCNPKPVCRSISSAFLPRAAGGRIQKAMSY
jgi:hypothetical protein